MRPLIKKRFEDLQFDYPVDVLLMMSMGECCVMCERPLPTDSRVWDRKKRQLIEGKVTAERWPSMLLLCHNCGQEAEKSIAHKVDDQDLIYPDQELTFSLKKESLFYYTLEKVEQVNLDENNQPIGKSVSKEVVLVQGNSEAAGRTIAFFKLNSHYYDQEKKSLLIPVNEESHHLDQRLDLRTRAWKQAEAFLQLFQQTDQQDIRNALITNLRNSISHSGFWSIWATVFWPVFEDKKMMETLFSQTQVSQAKREQGRKADTGPQVRDVHLLFPGTHQGWLD